MYEYVRTQGWMCESRTSRPILYISSDLDMIGTNILSIVCVYLNWIIYLFPRVDICIGIYLLH
jgi:hypothetical protein